jgi:hypothetical protein
MTWGIKLEGKVDFDFAKKPIGKRNMRLIAETVKTVIITETQDQGVNKFGRRFKPYSSLYKKVRKAAGYSDRPDMTVSGHMMRSIKPMDITDNGAVLGFVDTVTPPKRTILQKAWRKLDKDTQRSFYALAANAKRRAGKRSGVGGRQNPSATKGRRRSKAPQSGHPAPLASEKAAYTNRLRPWFGLGPRGSRRRAEVMSQAINLLQEVYSARMERRAARLERARQRRQTND